MTAAHMEHTGSRTGWIRSRVSVSQVPSPRRPTASRMAPELEGFGEMFQTQTRVRDSSSPRGVLAGFSVFVVSCVSTGCITQGCASFVSGFRLISAAMGSCAFKVGFRIRRVTFYYDALFLGLQSITVTIQMNKIM